MHVYKPMTVHWHAGVHCHWFKNHISHIPLPLSAPLQRRIPCHERDPLPRFFFARDCLAIFCAVCVAATPSLSSCDRWNLQKLQCRMHVILQQCFHSHADKSFCKLFFSCTCYAVPSFVVQWTAICCL